MTEERLLEILSIYGANPAAWPAQERQAALAVLAESQAAQAVCERESAFDRLLADAPKMEASPNLVAAILADAADHLALQNQAPTIASPSDTVRSSWRLPQLTAVLSGLLSAQLRPVALMLVAGVVGIGIGLSTATLYPVADEWEQLALIDEAVFGFDAGLEEFGSFMLEGAE